VKVTKGCSLRSAAIARSTSASTLTSLAPLLREISKATTGLPLSSATARRSAVPSVMRAMSLSRTLLPSASGMRRRESSATLATVAMVRTACSPPPMSPRPPGTST